MYIWMVQGKSLTVVTMVVLSRWSVLSPLVFSDPERGREGGVVDDRRVGRINRLPFLRSSSFLLTANQRRMKR